MKEENLVSFVVCQGILRQDKPSFLDALIKREQMENGGVGWSFWVVSQKTN